MIKRAPAFTLTIITSIVSYGYVVGAICRQYSTSTSIVLAITNTEIRFIGFSICIHSRIVRGLCYAFIEFCSWICIIWSFYNRTQFTIFWLFRGRCVIIALFLTFCIKLSIYIFVCLSILYRNFSLSLPIIFQSISPLLLHFIGIGRIISVGFIIVSDRFIWLSLTSSGSSLKFILLSISMFSVFWWLALLVW